MKKPKPSYAIQIHLGVFAILTFPEFIGESMFYYLLNSLVLILFNIIMVINTVREGKQR